MAEHSTVHGTSALAQAREFFAGEGLEFPEVPEAFISSLRALSNLQFGTCVLDAPLYNLELHVAQATTSPIADYLALGVDGHGINSWAIHYFLVQDGLALFLQLAWGGAYVEPDAARARIAAAFQCTATLRNHVAAAKQAGRIPPGRRLLAVDSDFAGSGWDWIDYAATGRTPIELRRIPAVLDNALRAVDLLGKPASL